MYEYTSGKQNTRQIAWFRYYLKLCTLDLKRGVAAKWCNCEEIHALCTKNWHKSLDCPECAQLSLVYCSEHESCAERFTLHNKVAFCSSDIPGIKKTKNTLNMTFSVYIPYLCAKLVQKGFACSEANCAQSSALCTRNDSSMTLLCNLSRMCTDSPRAL